MTRRHQSRARPHGWSGDRPGALPPQERPAKNFPWGGVALLVALFACGCAMEWGWM